MSAIVLAAGLLVVCSSAHGDTGDAPQTEGPWWRQVPTTLRHDTKSPFWAAFSSAVLPGAGQFYTRNEVRGLLFFFGQGTLMAMTLYEHVKSEDSKLRYERSGDSTDHEDYLYHVDRRRDLLWWDAAVWFLAVADAYVGAHMYQFKEGGRVAVLVGPTEEQRLGMQLTLRF